jgi:coatomer subunit delta
VRVQGILGLKDPDRPFPTGSALGVLKWRFQTRDESLVPLSINCWPSSSGGESYVNIEYEATADFDLQNVAIAIPLPALSQAPRVNQVWNQPPRNGSHCASNE